ncbi:MAG: diguanylate cyclase [Myxococcales bacterium]|nr:diguanylate cyclase [Myxococcales bacterium]
MQLRIPQRVNPFRSLPARISLFVFGATLLTSLIVTGISVRSIDTFLRGKLELKFPEIAQEASRLVDEWYGHQTLNLGVLAASDVLENNVRRLMPGANGKTGSTASHDVTEYLQYVRDRFPHFDSLFILQPDGETLVWVGSEYALTRETTDKLLKSVEKPMPVLSLVEGQFVQIVSARIDDRAGEMIGLLNAVMPLEAVAEPLRTQRLGDTGEIYLVNAAQIFVAAGRSHERTNILKRVLPSLRRLETVVDYTNDAGVRVVGYATPISEYGLTLVVEENYDEAFAPLLAAFRRVLSINLAVVLLFGVAAYRVAVSIARPIEALSEAARRISDDEDNVELPETRAQDEVGVLTRTFNEMTARLASKAEALERSQAETEQAVQQMREQYAELQRVNEVLEQLSITDGLTSLHNHRFFQEQLAKEIKRSDRVGDPLALILIDIDHFKKWNDKIGHAGGDEVLRKIANVMNEIVRETDVLARYGGEEFALILPKTDMDGAMKLAEKIRASVAASSIVLDLPSEHMRLTVSVGVNVYRGDAKAFFSGADQALYRAKDGGRDCVMVTEELD